MIEKIADKKTLLCIGLAAASTGLLLLFTGLPAKADGDREGGVDQAVTKARDLVESLEARLRSTEADLKEARSLLARLERGDKPLLKPEAKEVAEPPADDSGLVEGVWRIVGIGGHETGVFQKPPYDEYKIMSAGHYLWLSFDPATGKRLRSGGGSYSIQDGKYSAKIECSSSEDLRSVIGREYTGTCRVEGNKWFHFGKVPTGGGFDELWERVN
jgi:hypothetical protein